MDESDASGPLSFCWRCCDAVLTHDFLGARKCNVTRFFLTLLVLHGPFVWLITHPNSIFLSEEISHQQPANGTFLSEQISTSHQPPAK
jgi:hypothetical protein